MTEDKIQIKAELINGMYFDNEHGLIILDQYGIRSLSFTIIILNILCGALGLLIGWKFL
jgi:hypothetical protein